MGISIHSWPPPPPLSRCAGGWNDAAVAKVGCQDKARLTRFDLRLACAEPLAAGRGIGRVANIVSEKESDTVGENSKHKRRTEAGLV